MTTQIHNKNYYRIMPGARSKYADLCHNEGFIGADYGFRQDFGGKLPDDWRQFNKKFIPVYLKGHPEKTKIAAGLACGMLWTVCKGYRMGDIVLSPDGQGYYKAGEVASEYYYQAGDILPHRRKVRWLEAPIARADMSPALQRSTNSIGTSCQISKYREEIEVLLNGNSSQLMAVDPSIEDPSVFALEKHLEDFLVKNWEQTELGGRYKIYEDEGDLVGQQYQSDTGPIDILAISKDGKELLVVELKKGRASDVVVGQIQRYMGYIKDELAEKGQVVKGVIIALEDDLRLQRALSVTQNISFYKYQVSFKLIKGFTS